MRMEIKKTENEHKTEPLQTRLGLSSTTLHQTVREQKNLQVINGNLQ